MNLIDDADELLIYDSFVARPQSNGVVVRQSLKSPGVLIKYEDLEQFVLDMENYVR